MTTRYLVGHNMVGYLPDNDPYYVRTKRAAISASHSDAVMGRDDNDDYYDDGPGKDRYHLSGKAGDYWITADDGPTIHYWYVPVEVCREYLGLELGYESCVNCSNRLHAGDTIYRIPENGDILCEDC